MSITKTHTGKKALVQRKLIHNPTINIKPVLIASVQNTIKLDHTLNTCNYPNIKYVLYIFKEMIKYIVELLSLCSNKPTRHLQVLTTYKIATHIRKCTPKVLPIDYCP